MKPAASKNRLLLALGFIFPLVILLAVAALAYVSSNMLRGSQQWVVHTLEVRDSLHQLLLSVTEVESNQRGYMLTKHDRYLTQYEKQRVEVGTLLSSIASLVADNQAQEMRLTPLGTLIQERLDWATLLISLKKSDQDAEMYALINTGRGQQEMDQIHDIIDLMTASEDQLLVERRRAVETNLRLDDSILFSLVLLDLLVIGGVVYLLLRVRRLQQLVTICAWSKTVRYNGEWLSIEDYLHQRYGVRVTHGISEAEFAKLSQETEVHEGQEN